MGGGWRGRAALATTTGAMAVAGRATASFAAWIAFFESLFAFLSILRQESHWKLWFKQLLHLEYASISQLHQLQ
jgi:hypothetical protein